MPLISVILPVYNTEKYIKAALNSILNQSLQDFEVIVIDDCSSDGTVNVIRSFTDKRVQLHINSENRGRAYCDNFGQQMAKGTFVAKMDADDICYPERFKKQVTFLQKNPQVNTVGTAMQNFGSSQYLNWYPHTPELAKAYTLFALPVGNPSVMFRSTLFVEKGMKYDEQLRQTEDYDFFSRYINQLSIANLETPLIKYRNYPMQTKRDVLEVRGQVADQVRESLLKEWGILENEQEIDLHNRLCQLGNAVGYYDLDATESWLRKLIRYNKHKPWFDEKALAQVIGERWFEACYNLEPSSLSHFRKYSISDLQNLYRPGLYKKIKFFIRKSSLDFKLPVV